MRKYWGRHPDTAVYCNNLAFLYLNRGDYERALAYFLKAYRIYVLVFGIEHPRSQAVIECLSDIYPRCNPEGNFTQWLEEKMKE